MNDTIKSKIADIKRHIGVELNLCDYFTGIKESVRGDYFNVTLDEPVSESLIYDKLLRLASNGSVIRLVEPNGYKRLAIFY